MGGLDSEITDATTVVALEIAILRADRDHAHDEPSRPSLGGVRPVRAWRRSVRHAERAQARFVELLRETCPNLVVHAGAVDARHDSLPPRDALDRGQGQPGEPHPRHRRSMPPTIDRLITPIGYTRSSGADGDMITVALPSWRPDSTEEIDVVEEVARHYGYDTIGKAVPKSTMHGRLSTVQQRRRALRQVLLGAGLNEAITDTFLHERDLVAAQLPADAIRITNPLQADDDVLRPSMRPGLLRAIGFNESHRRSEVALFEIGHVYPRGDGTAELPPEYDGLAVAMAGRRCHGGNGHLARDRPSDGLRRAGRPVAGAGRPAPDSLGHVVARP